MSIKTRFQARLRKIKPATIFIVATCLMLILPVIYTGMKLGLFYREPTITLKLTAPANAPVLRIVADRGFKPRVYVNQQQQSAGSDVEVALEAANRLGMRPVIIHGDWLECRDKLSKGQADVLLGLEIFSNMRGVIKTVPVGSDRLRVYGKNTVTDAAALAGKRVAIMGKSVIMAHYELNCLYVEYYTNKDILKAVEEGKVDYAICHATVADNIIKDNGYQLKKSFAVAASFPAFAVREDNIVLRDKLNQVLVAMAEDGSMQRILQKWQGPTNLTIIDVLGQNKSAYLAYAVLFLVIEGVLGTYMAILKRKAQQEQYLEEQKLYAQQRAELENTRTKLILSQIKPHFIYNTMSTITYLCKKNSELAQQISLDFAKYLRGNLVALDSSQLIPFTKELEHIKTYLKIECVRFEDILQVQYDIQTTDFKIPVLTVEPLVENAVKHGICEKEEGGTVTICTRKLADGYQVLIKDDGAGFDMSSFDFKSTEHVGLRSVRKRIELLCHGTLTMESKVGVGTTAILTLPKQAAVDENQSKA